MSFQCDITGCLDSVTHHNALWGNACLAHTDDWRAYLKDPQNPYISWKGFASWKNSPANSLTFLDLDEPTNPEIYLSSPTCECGSAAVGSPKHSDWCALNG